MIYRRFSTLANNYKPLPISICRAKDIYMWDTNGKKYVDLLAGYSAVNQGHCHPKLIKCLYNQANQLTLCSRVVSAQPLNVWANYITNKFEYDTVLVTNSGTEAVETAIKLARKYGTKILGMQNPLIVCLKGNFHGRTMGSLSLSDYPPYTDGFNPLLPNILHVEPNNTENLIKVFKQNSNNISAFIYEPVQGEGGIVALNNEFINCMQQLKAKYPHILFMADEIQCGLGRVGGMTANQILMPGLKPDVLIQGKALGGGILPISCCLANWDKMRVFQIGSHGSTFGGNPLAASISVEAIKIIESECLDNVKLIKSDFEKALHQLPKNNIIDIRGMGLFWGIQFKKNFNLENLRIKFLQRGYVSCTSRHNTLRITPPLTISIEESKRAICILGEILSESTSS